MLLAICSAPFRYIYQHKILWSLLLEINLILVAEIKLQKETILIRESVSLLARGVIF